MIIQTLVELKKYFDANELYEDTFLSEAKEEKSEDSTNVILMLGYTWFYEGTEAGSKIGERKFTLLFKDVTFFKNRLLNQNSYIHDYYMDTTQEGLLIRLQSSGEVEIHFKYLEVEDYQEEMGTIEPEISPNEVEFHILLNEIPKPAQWLQWLGEKSFHKVVWRTYGSEATIADKVNYPDYEGWFLQTEERLKINNYGVWFRSIELKQGILKISLRNDDENTSLFEAIKEIIQSNKIVNVKTGNCIFDEEQWKQYLLKGELPYNV